MEKNDFERLKSFSGKRRNDLVANPILKMDEAYIDDYNEGPIDTIENDPDFSLSPNHNDECKTQKGISISHDPKLGKKLRVETEILVQNLYEDDDNILLRIGMQDFVSVNKKIDPVNKFKTDWYYTIFLNYFSILNLSFQKSK